MSEFWVVNSEHTKKAFFAHIAKQFDEKKYITYKWRYGQDRSLDQNALFHVWVTEFIAHLAGCSKKEVGPSQIEAMKKKLKEWAYRAHGWGFLIYVERCLLTGDDIKGYTSSTSWKTGEMFEFLNWFQMFAAEKGLVLESKGEYQKLKREQNG